MTLFLVVGIGILIGVVFAGLVMAWVMRRSMVVAERCAGSFDEVCAAIGTEVPGADGWGFPIESFDMGAKLAAMEALPGNVQQIRLFFLCNPSVAHRVLGDTPKLSAIMPCSWSVYELDDGTVWLSHMNIGMMSKLMGGVVGEAMGEVAKTDEEMLDRITVVTER